MVRGIVKIGLPRRSQYFERTIPQAIILAAYKQIVVAENLHTRILPCMSLQQNPVQLCCLGNIWSKSCPASDLQIFSGVHQMTLQHWACQMPLLALPFAA